MNASPRGPTESGAASTPRVAPSVASIDWGEELRPLVPPSGALPRRFGAGELRSAVERVVPILSILGATAAVIVFFLRGRLPDLVGSIASAAVIPLALHVASFLFGKRSRLPLSVVFEPAGVVIYFPWRSRSFAWGELIGLIAPIPGENEWVLVARRGVLETRIRLDASKTWVAAMLDELTGTSFNEPVA